VQETCLAAIRAGIVASAHDCADGGLAVALAECCMAGPGPRRGARVELSGDMRPDALLFGESASRILLSVRPDSAEGLEAMARGHGVPCARLGVVERSVLMIRGRRFTLNVPVEKAHAAWSTGLRRALT
jgi:phosphoribosylformylglycinamidine synthase